MHRPFTVYRRPTRKKKRFIYYIQFRDEYGQRMTAVSSGKTTRVEAERWAYEQINREVVNPSPEQKFRDYART
ncbi:MAG: hypothetical protein V3V57_06935, partial [Spirochaetia bacterium]